MDVAQLVGTARDMLTVKRVFGEPIHHNDVRVIPVARVRGGGGGGGGSGSAPDGDGSGGGGGFGMMASPAGVYVIKGDHVTWHPARDPGRTELAGLTLAALAVLAIRSIVVRTFGHR
ncbi:MAG: hypothetical protein K8R99_03960 [Actinomycetia bacterium]|nr:hypothetical protein [Actinomycetes bacterium]